MFIRRSQLRRLLRENLILSEERAPFFLAPSDIHGLGVFTDREFKQGQPIGVSHVERPTVGWDVTDLGRYHNHSERPTCANVTDSGVRRLHAIRDLPPGVEITIDYRNQPDLEQPRENWHT